MANRDWGNRAPRTQGVEHVYLPVVILPQGAPTVGAARITAAGSAYTSAPTVVFSGGGGGGALGFATLTGAALASITIVSGGSGYTSAPTIALNVGGGSGAAGTATVSAGGSITAAGSGYSNAPIVTFAGAGGSATATATANIFTSVGSFTVTNAGSGYTTVPTVIVSGGGGSGAAGAATISGGTVASITVTAAGSGYLGAPTVSLQGGGGFGATATAATFSSVSSLTITSGGSGYTGSASFSFAAGSGLAGAATAVLNPALGEGDPNQSYFTPSLGPNGGSLGLLQIATVDPYPGLLPFGMETTSGWRAKFGIPVQGSSNAWTFSIFTATDATAINSVTVSAAGSGYTSAPTVNLNAANGIVGFSAVATISGGTVTKITVVNPGFGASTTPTLTLTGGGGSGATATAVLGAGTAVDMAQGTSLYMMARFRNSSVKP